MSGKNMSSKELVRTHCSAKRLFQALALAVPVLAATTSSQAAPGGIWFHIGRDNPDPTLRWGIWLHITRGQQQWTNVSPDGTQGDLDATLPGLDPIMGLDFPLPGTEQVLTGDASDSANMRGGKALADKLLNRVNLAGLWITGSDLGVRWGIHLTTPVELLLPLEGKTPEGQLTHALHGVSIPFQFNVTREGLPDLLVEKTATDISWTSDARIPTPGAFALFGVGALAAIRRRRS